MADFAAWFRREHYDHIREIMEDGERLPPSFDQWEQLAKSQVENARRGGIIIKPGMLDPDKFIQWPAGRRC
jgi:hypothetical protein